MRRRQPIRTSSGRSRPEEPASRFHGFVEHARREEEEGDVGRAPFGLLEGATVRLISCPKRIPIERWPRIYRKDDRVRGRTPGR